MGTWEQREREKERKGMGLDWLIPRSLFELSFLIFSLHRLTLLDLSFSHLMMTDMSRLGSTSRKTCLQ